jgi:hypothetical protein
VTARFTPAGLAALGERRQAPRRLPRRVLPAWAERKPEATEPHAPFTPEMATGMSEATLQGHVMSEARDLGWRRYHTHDSRRSPRGFPDLCMVHRRQDRCVFVELKQEAKGPSDEQVEWGEDLLALTTVEFYLWRPTQWLDGTVKRVLLGRPA